MNTSSENLIHKPWRDKCTTTGLTVQEFIDRLDGVEAPDWAKRAAIAICRSFGITGWSDPGYIANVIKAQFLCYRHSLPGEYSRCDFCSGIRQGTMDDVKRKIEWLNSKPNQILPKA